jgi:hypothetical protein
VYVAIIKQNEHLAIDSFSTKEPDSGVTVPPSEAVKVKVYVMVSVELSSVLPLSAEPILLRLVCSRY